MARRTSQPRPGAKLARNQKARARKKEARTAAWQKAATAARSVLEKEGDDSAPLDTFISKFYHGAKRRRR